MVFLEGQALPLEDRKGRGKYTLPRIIEQRRSWFGRVKCEKCGKYTAKRVCPKCHCELPVDFRSIKDLRICILGRTGHGKSVYLSVVLQNLLDRPRDLGVTLTPRTESTQERWKLIYSQPLFVQGELPIPTDEFSKNPSLKEPLIFGARFQGYIPYFYPLRRTLTVNLSFYDCAGEDTNNQAVFDSAHPALAHADALIVMVSGRSFPGLRRGHNDEANYMLLPNLIEQHFKNIGEPMVGIPTAFVVTKLDDIWPNGQPLGDFERRLLVCDDPQEGLDVERCRDSSERMTELLERNGGRDLVGLAQEYYPRHMFFGVSSLGHTPIIDGNNKKRIIGDKFVHMNVFSPLFWLFYELGLIAHS